MTDEEIQEYIAKHAKPRFVVRESKEDDFNNKDLIKELFDIEDDDFFS